MYVTKNCCPAALPIYCTKSLAVIVYLYAFSETHLDKRCSVYRAQLQLITYTCRWRENETNLFSVATYALKPTAEGGYILVSLLLKSVLCAKTVQLNRSCFLPVFPETVSYPPTPSNICEQHGGGVGFFLARDRRRAGAATNTTGTTFDTARTRFLRLSIALGTTKCSFT